MSTVSCPVDTIEENTFYHGGHEGHEEVAIRLVAHRGTEGGDTKLKLKAESLKLKDLSRTKQDGQDCDD